MTPALLLIALSLPAAAPAKNLKTDHPAPHSAVPLHAPAHKPVAKIAPMHPLAHPLAHPPAPVVAAPEPAPTPGAPDKGSVTGMPVPRFAALKTDEVNLRSGPGLRYPIQWVYKRRDLPVQIEREFEVWRLISDQDGERGWVNQATLTGRRSFIVKVAKITVRSDANLTASPVAELQAGVVGRIRACEAASDWCQVQVGDYRGWLQRTAVWGIYPNEAVQ